MTCNNLKVGDKVTVAGEFTVGYVSGYSSHVDVKHADGTHAFTAPVTSLKKVRPAEPKVGSIVETSYGSRYVRQSDGWHGLSSMSGEIGWHRSAWPDFDGSDPRLVERSATALA